VFDGGDLWRRTKIVSTAYIRPYVRPRIVYLCRWWGEKMFEFVFMKVDPKPRNFARPPTII
jgi:hypothetical protein